MFGFKKLEGGVTEILNIILIRNKIIKLLYYSFQIGYILTFINIKNEQIHKVDKPEY